jgi:hypothetical protein
MDQYGSIWSICRLFLIMLDHFQSWQITLNPILLIVEPLFLVTSPYQPPTTISSSPFWSDVPLLRFLVLNFHATFAGFQFKHLFRTYLYPRVPNLSSVPIRIWNLWLTSMFITVYLGDEMDTYGYLHEVKDMFLQVCSHKNLRKYANEYPPVN